MPERTFTPSSYVAAQVKNIRIRRRWSQQKLADRLRELFSEPPPWVARLEPNDPRAHTPTASELPTKTWTQSRVAKLERGALKQITVDDLFELALALDVSPLYLLTPALEPHEESEREERWSLLHPQKDDVFKVALGHPLYAGTLSRSPHEVRQWIRGVKPLLPLGAYRTNEEAKVGHRFYLLDSQSLSEWDRIADCGRQAERIRGAAAALEFGDDDGE
jgi:transcriptional regulator with XRE-family HTH domain